MTKIQKSSAIGQYVLGFVPLAQNIARINKVLTEGTTVPDPSTARTQANPDPSVAITAAELQAAVGPDFVAYIAALAAVTPPTT